MTPYIYILLYNNEVKKTNENERKQKKIGNFFNEDYRLNDVVQLEIF